MTLEYSPLESAVGQHSHFSDLRYHGYEVSVRLERRNTTHAPYRVRGPADAYALMKDLEHETAECMYELLLDARHRVVGVYHLSRGATDATLLDPREVFRPALLSNAVAILLVHNHPSGDPTPSVQDRAVTEQLRESCKLLGYSLLDHIILGSAGQYVALSEQGLL